MQAEAACLEHLKAGYSEYHLKLGSAFITNK